MSEENYKKCVELIDSLPEENKNYINQYLNNAPRWILESMQIVRKKKNSIFIEEGAAVDYVYILVEGIVRAIDYRIFGIVYDYMWFYPVKVFGSMEILLNMKLYKTTLMTAGNCTMLVIPKSKFELWMQNDMLALHMEVESMGTYLLEQARTERVFLFLQGIDRVIYLVIRIYEQNGKKPHCQIDLTRKELAERSGLSIKTINRSIKKMEQNHYIEKLGNKILISAAQYRIMKDYLAPIVDQN